MRCKYASMLKRIFLGIPQYRPDYTQTRSVELSFSQVVPYQGITGCIFIDIVLNCTLHGSLARHASLLHQISSTFSTPSVVQTSEISVPALQWRFKRKVKSAQAALFFLLSGWRVISILETLINLFR